MLKIFKDNLIFLKRKAKWQFKYLYVSGNISMNMPINVGKSLVNRLRLRTDVLGDILKI